MSFDWVTARSKCSMPALFAILGEAIRTDVETVNKLPRVERKFEITTYTERRVIVVRSDEEASGEDRIVFERSNGGITVRKGESQILFRGKPVLDKAGECFLEIEGQPYTLWQVARKALEDFFFAE